MEAIDFLPVLMFVALAVLLFSGYPVAFVLGGVGLGFGFLGMALEVFNFNEFFLIVLRIHGAVVDNLVLVAIPMFIFMGTMLEKSGLARDLLNCLQVLLRRVPGGLALAVTVLGTIMAATTGIIGASVVMMTLLALPVMLENRYQPSLASGTIAASGTLGILIPPSIMLVIMAELLSISVGTLFMAAVIPGLILSLLYLGYIYGICRWWPQLAMSTTATAATVPGAESLARLVFRGFLPPVLLIALVLGSIFAGFATPTEASGIGAFGATLLALVRGKLNFAMFRDVCERSALTGAMLFGIFIGATAFSYVFRSLGGDELILYIVGASDLGAWGILLVSMAVVFLLGFFFDWIEITLIVLPIFAPIIKSLDFGGHIAAAEYVVPWFAILVAVNLQTSFLTPPFGFALFYLKGSAPKSISIGQIYRGVAPFVVLQLIGLGLVTAFPQIALWLPGRFLD